MWLSVTSITAALLVFFIIERGLNAILCLACFFLGSSAKGTVAFPPLQLLVSLSTSMTRLVASLVSVMTSVVSGLVLWSTYTLVLLLVCGTVYLAYEQYPFLARAFGIRWNAEIGPRISAHLVAPYDMSVKLLSPIVPLYNVGIFVVRKMYLHGLLTPAILHPQDLLKAGASLGRVGMSSAESIADYSEATLTPTGEFLWPYALDVVTPMAHIRNTVAHLARWVGNVACAQLVLPLDILIAPWMDITFAKAVHNLVNAVVYTFVQVPVVTQARCKKYYNSTQQHQDPGIIMCIPDFEPTFQFLVTGLRLLGQALDTWLNIILLVVRTVVDPESVPTGICDSKINVATLNLTRNSLFGGNNSVLVALTDTMYAETDGYSVIYFSTARYKLCPGPFLPAKLTLVDLQVGCRPGNRTCSLAHRRGPHHGHSGSLVRSKRGAFGRRRPRQDHLHAGLQV